MNDKKIRFGIIGLGYISNRFATVLNTCSEAEIEAVAARSKERAIAFSEKYNAKKYYDNYSDLICDPDVDIIYIGLTHNFHYEIAKECVEHGKAVLCEKPFFICRNEAEKLISLAKQKNVLLMEAMWTRCLPSYLKAKKWIDDGKIGDVKFIDAQFSFHIDYDPTHRLFNTKLAGGALYDAGVYPIELAIGIMDESPDIINSIHTTAANGVDDFDLIGMHFPNGAMASLLCGFNVATSPDAYIYGTKGHIVICNFVFAKRAELYDKDKNLVDFIEDSAEDGFIYEIDNVISLYRNGKIESDLIPWKDTIECAGIFDRLTEQWNQNKQ